ncbi:MAG: hypothetical protein A2Y38_22630 [Spirochaetes bacterium GWB1_59_5]|nr:MAG: hypothetical protein A2Y38_22630 [Spirochaetes bacterium GWB1_59_5]
MIEEEVHHKNCARCRKPFSNRGHFEIRRKNGAGDVISAVPLCSMLCLAQWSYEECVRQGVRIVGGAQTAYERVKAWIMGT